MERLAALAAELGGEAVALDVADPNSVDELAARVPRCDVLVNNAGGAHGLEPLGEADEDKWRTMYEVNVLGTMRMTRALLPRLVASGDDHVVTSHVNIDEIVVRPRDQAAATEVHRE